jgi:hypothetical protein
MEPRDGSGMENDGPRTPGKDDAAVALRTTSVISGAEVVEEGAEEVMAASALGETKEEVKAEVPTAAVGAKTWQRLGFRTYRRLIPCKTN